MAKYIVTKERTAIQQWLVEAPDEGSAMDIARQEALPTDDLYTIDLLEDDWEDMWMVSDA